MRPVGVGALGRGGLFGIVLLNFIALSLQTETIRLAVRTRPFSLGCAALGLQLPLYIAEKNEKLQT